ncbi:MAG: hypothetical protein Q9160_007902, partial [Pyrenula sp. 1 TL-2023]
DKLAPISGSIDETDASPLAAAIRELREETFLATPADLKLSLRGHSFSISDPSIGRQWTVYPFSWILKPASEQKISIDWEHSTWEWIELERILSGSMESECVPRLSESLRRVYIGPNSLALTTPRVAFNLHASEVLRSTLHDLQTDHTNGAKVLATKAGTAVAKLATECKILPSEPSRLDLEAWFRILRMASWLLITNGRPSMNSAITTCILGLLSLILPIISSPPQSPTTKISETIQSALSSRSSTSDRIASSFSEYLNSTVQRLSSSIPQPQASASGSQPLTLNILTLSSSSTLLHSLAHFLSHLTPQTSNLNLHLSILESRPLFEGLSLATSLPYSPNLSITLAPDSSIALLARNTDLVLLGADRISASGDVSNKTGSYAAACVTKAVGKEMEREVRVVVVSESEKVAKPDERNDEGEEDNGPEDVVGAWRRSGFGGGEVEGAEDEEGIVRIGGGSAGEGEGRKIKVKNVYFEWVPAKYIDAYVTEKGIMGTDDIRETAIKMGELEKEMFADLAQIE